MLLNMFLQSRFDNRTFAVGRSLEFRETPFSVKILHAFNPLIQIQGADERFEYVSEKSRPTAAAGYSSPFPSRT